MTVGDDADCKKSSSHVPEPIKVYGTTGASVITGLLVGAGPGLEVNPLFLCLRADVDTARRAHPASANLKKREARMLSELCLRWVVWNAARPTVVRKAGL